jgi:3-phenylpropionate/trans-cinnamate dioxygenase ferredoxin subunit
MATERRSGETKFVVAKTSDIPDGGRIIVDVNGRSIGVFNVGGEFHAVLNRCPHAGAPLCRGSLVGYLEAKVPGSYNYDSSRKLLQCPWHGWEFDIRTGQSYCDPEKTRVRRYATETAKGSELNEAVAAAEVADPASHEVRGERESRPYGVPLERGPYRAELIPVEIEDDYVVVPLRSH